MVCENAIGQMQARRAKVVCRHVDGWCVQWRLNDDDQDIDKQTLGRIRLDLDGGVVDEEQEQELRKVPKIIPSFQHHPRGQPETWSCHFVWRDTRQQIAMEHQQGRVGGGNEIQSSGRGRGGVNPRGRLTWSCIPKLDGETQQKGQKDERSGGDEVVEITVNLER